jgi:hypothetical protein
MLGCEAELADVNMFDIPAGCVRVVSVPVAPASQAQTSVSLILPVPGVTDGDVFVPEAFAVAVIDPSKPVPPAKDQAEKNQCPLVAVVVQEKDPLNAPADACRRVKIAVTTSAPEPFAVVAKDVAQPPGGVKALGAVAPPTVRMTTMNAPIGTLPVEDTVTLVPLVNVPLLSLALNLDGEIPIPPSYLLIDNFLRNQTQSPLLTTPAK